MDALRGAESNAWLSDLDRYFTNLKESKRLPLVGREPIEDKFVVLSKILHHQVVPPFSGARYFSDSLKIPDSDHFTIAKPTSRDALQHRALVKFALQCFGFLDKTSTDHTSKPHYIDSADQLTPKPRVLDAAMPSHIVKDRATELLVLIHLPESEGLAGILQADEGADARPEDVRWKKFEVIFPKGPTGTPEALKVNIKLTSPDFTPQSQNMNVFLPVNADTEVFPFVLTPVRLGALTVWIELVWEDAERGYRRLFTNCVSESELSAVKPVMKVVQLLVGVTSDTPPPPPPPFGTDLPKPPPHPPDDAVSTIGWAPDVAGGPMKSGPSKHV